MDRSSGGRQKHVSSGGGSVHKRGSGLNLGGPVGSGGRESNTGRSSGPAGGGPRKSGGGLFGLIFAVVIILFGGGSFLTGGLGGAGDSSYSGGQNYSFNSGVTAGNGWVRPSNSGKMDSSVAEGSREKMTDIKGDGTDQVTVMVYMCGTDLESRSGMATADIQEMAAARFGKNVNVLVYTGGCRGWKNKVVSSQTNQIYQVKDGGLICKERNLGSTPMTDPSNLTYFIKWCNKNYPANRRQLILWDHGGGSVTGYGYDEKYPRSGAMSLAQINTALKNAGTSFDFIGFDACLMATMENGLMLSKYADYMIASEESEPGYGWYYTNWLQTLSEDPAISTVELGKQIADDFVQVCARKGQGSNTTLSVTDLAELGTYGPQAMNAFAKTATDLIQNNHYQKVSLARTQTKEFAQSSKIDQVDLTHLALNMDTEEGKALADVICGAVKYNRVANNINNAYGLSVYFPYKKVSSVDSMVKTYEAIGLDNAYSRCIQEFAGAETVGQVASGGTTNPMGSLFHSSQSSGQQSTPSNASMNQDAMMQLLMQLMSGKYKGIEGLDSSNTAFLHNVSLDKYTSYVEKNQLSAEQLKWEKSGDKKVLKLSSQDWDKIENLALNVYYDDGDGFIDLGLDNVYEFTEDGDLLGEYDRTWLAIDGQIVPYYFMEESRNGNQYQITGCVPAFLNGNRVDLILIFDNDTPDGRIEGARYFYENGETDTIAKELTSVKAGDKLDFVCNYYSYDGKFQNNYYLGETLVVGKEIEISNVDVGEAHVSALYRITDMYNQHYWTPEM